MLDDKQHVVLGHIERGELRGAIENAGREPEVGALGAKFQRHETIFDRGQHALNGDEIQGPSRRRQIPVADNGDLLRRC